MAKILLHTGKIFEIGEDVPMILPLLKQKGDCNFNFFIVRDKEDNPIIINKSSVVAVYV